MSCTLDISLRRICLRLIGQITSTYPGRTMNCVGRKRSQTQPYIASMKIAGAHRILCQKTAPTIKPN